MLAKGEIRRKSFLRMITRSSVELMVAACRRATFSCCTATIKKTKQKQACKQKTVKRIESWAQYFLIIYSGETPAAVQHNGSCGSIITSAAHPNIVSLLLILIILIVPKFYYHPPPSSTPSSPPTPESSTTCSSSNSSSSCRHWTYPAGVSAPLNLLTSMQQKHISHC